jgi:Holliday junction resolvase RusA-like endonuclease
MVKTLTYTISGPPTPWAAPRQCGKIYYNPKHKEKMRAVAEIVEQLIRPITGPIRVDMTFHMPIPRSKAKKVKEGDWHTCKPDATNIRKLYEDVLEIAGVYKNDSQVCEGYSKKIYSLTPRTEIKVTPLMDEEVE